MDNLLVADGIKFSNPEVLGLSDVLKLEFSKSMNFKDAIYMYYKLRNNYLETTFSISNDKRRVHNLDGKIFLQNLTSEDSKYFSLSSGPLEEIPTDFEEGEDEINYFFMSKLGFLREKSFVIEKKKGIYQAILSASSKRALKNFGKKFHKVLEEVLIL